MKKIVILSLIAPAVLGLAACGGAKVDNTLTTNDVVANVDDLNATDANAVVDANATDANTVVAADNVANAN